MCNYKGKPRHNVIEQSKNTKNLTLSEKKKQRIFFGLTKGGSKYDGRLNFYCQKVLSEDLLKIYRAMDEYLDEVDRITQKAKNEFDIFKILVSRPIFFTV